MTRFATLFSETSPIEQRDLIRMLNPVIQGWVNYHRHAVSSVAFSKLDLHGLEVALAVGKTQASRQEPDVDQATLLAYARFTDVDLRNRRRHRRQAENYVTGVRDGHPDPSSCQGASGGQPVLATVGRLPCGTSRSARCQLTQRTGATSAPVAVARRALLGMRRAHHPGDRLGGSSRTPAGRRGSERYSNLRLLHPNCHRQHHANEDGPLPGPRKRADVKT